jgi:hypothetical protein
MGERQPGHDNKGGAIPFMSFFLHSHDFNLANKAKSDTLKTIKIKHPQLSNHLNLNNVVLFH